MKKLTVLLVAIGLMMPIMAQKVVSDDYNSLQVHFTTGDVHIGQTVLDGETFSTLTIDGHVPSTFVGSPNLPVYSRLIEVPLCDGYKVTVTDAVYDTIGPVKHWVVPTQPSRRKSDTSAAKLVISKEVYSWDAFIGDREAFVEPVGIARDRNLARLQFSPVRYNPASGMLIVCRQATVTVSYDNPDVKATEELFKRYYSPAFNSGANALNSLYPKSISNAAPVRYLIVANSMFRGQMDTFVQWKKRKGFLTDIVYTDDAAVGTTTTSIKAYLQSQYTTATATNPAPTFVLLVGDVAQIPAFNGTEQNSHVTDLYYSTWTSSDNIPDCHYGRFSAQNNEQLIPQIQKTLMYEQYTFADPSYLDRAVMIAGIDRGSSGDHGYTHGDPALDYGITNYFNGANGFSNVYYFKNNTSIVPQGVTNVTVSGNGSSNLSTIRSRINQGAGYINYTAHGSSAGWYSPSFETDQVAIMTNSQKFGLMIGNCCETNMYGENECFGESLLRKDNYCGAVGYIGGSQVTYWDEDFYWAVGVRSSIGPNISMYYNANNLGAYDHAFHTHDEAYSEWITNQSAFIYFGNMAVQSSSSDLKKYYWEIYHLMGDPSVMTYLTQAPEITINAPIAITYGTTSLTVTAAPYAYVALTDPAAHTLIAAAWANAAGQATLQIPEALPVGSYEIAASAPQHRTTFRNINVLVPDGSFVMATSVTPAAELIAGTTVMLTFVFENAGNVDAQNVTVRLVSSNPMLTLTNDSLNLGTIAAGGQTTVNSISAIVNSAAADLTNLTISATTRWAGSDTYSTNYLPLSIVGPTPVINTSLSNLSILPGNTGSFTATLRNDGHATLQSARLSLSSPTSLITVSPATTATANLAPGDSLTCQFSIAVSNNAPMNLEIPLTLQGTSSATTISKTLLVYIGEPNIEDFENDFNFSGWTQGSKRWIVDASNYHSNSHSIRSAQNLSNYGGKSETSITLTYTNDDSVTFYYKVSSEENYDFFRFYIDGTEMIAASGNVDWTRAAFPISSGNHTFKFSYEKDWGGSLGSDCAWIDDLSLPRTVVPFDTTGLAIATVDDGLITVYPNPTVNKVHFSRSVDEAILFDLNGRMLMRRNDTDMLDINTLATGTYVLRLRNGDATSTCRIIKR